MNAISTALVVCLVAVAATASEVVRVYTVYPVDFGDNEIRHSYHLVSPSSFQRGETPRLFVRTPIHDAIEELYRKVEKVDMRGSQRPSLSHIEFTNGIVCVYSKNNRPDEWDVQETMRLCLKLSIGETLSIRSNNSYGITMPDVRGFQMIYGNGTVFPKSGYYAVIEAIKEDEPTHSESSTPSTAR